MNYLTKLLTNLINYDFIRNFQVKEKKIKAALGIDRIHTEYYSWNSATVIVMLE